jgi:hypothetical protein
MPGGQVQIFISMAFERDCIVRGAVAEVTPFWMKDTFLETDV